MDSTACVVFSRELLLFIISGSLFSTLKCCKLVFLYSLVFFNHLVCSILNI